MARMRALCAVAAAAAALLLAAPAAADAAQGSKRAVFSASLAPLPNTTGVSLSGSGFARIAFNTANARGDNQFTLDVKDLARLAAASAPCIRPSAFAAGLTALPWGLVGLANRGGSHPQGAAFRKRFGRDHRMRSLCFASGLAQASLAQAPSSWRCAATRRRSRCRSCTTLASPAAPPPARASPTPHFSLRGGSSTTRITACRALTACAERPCAAARRLGARRILRFRSPRPRWLALTRWPPPSAPSRPIPLASTPMYVFVPFIHNEGCCSRSQRQWGSRSDAC